MDKQKNTDAKVGMKGYIALVIAVLFFSGLFGKMDGPWRVLDLQTLLGSYGVIAEGASAGIVGTGGYGVKEGFFQAINMAPATITAVAFLAVIEHYGGLKAAQKLLTPLLKPLLGVPGSTGLAIITNWQSSDASAALAGKMEEEKKITKKQRDILVAYEFVAAATLGVFYSNGAVVFPYLVASQGGLLLMLMVVKFVSGNLMRLYCRFFEKDTQEAESHGN